MAEVVEQPAQQVQSPEFKHQYLQKNKKRYKDF
jgi:hypothetical protein